MRPRRPQLILTLNLWTLDGHPSPRREWSLARKCRAIAEAGFDAVNAPASPELALLLPHHGLRFMGFFASSNPAEIPPFLQAQVDAGADFVNVQLGRENTSPTTAQALVDTLLSASRHLPVEVGLETHRDTVTETPEKTYALADHYQHTTGRILPLTIDPSHFAVVKHLKPSLYEEVLFRRPELIQAARSFHLRPFNGQHAQVPVINAHGRQTPEFRTWLNFAEALLRLWLAGPRPGNALWVCPEIGPIGIHGYNLSTFEPSWHQAIVCARELRRMWRRLVKQTG